MFVPMANSVLFRFPTGMGLASSARISCCMSSTSISSSSSVLWMTLFWYVRADCFFSSFSDR